MISFERVVSDAQIASVTKLASTIWHQHYPAIITREQIAYMIERFQSESAIRQQLDDGYHYALIFDDEEIIGYLAVIPDRESHEMFLSKVYLLVQHRGKGAGFATMHYIAQQAHQYGCSRIWLTVNRMNRIAIDAYRKWGFTITDEVIADIGNGFFMDDYRMEKILDGSESGDS